MTLRNTALPAVTALAIALTLGGGASAQTAAQDDQDHQAHHPGETLAQAPTTPVPAAPVPNATPPAPSAAPQATRPATPGMGMMPGQAGQPGMGMMPGQAGQPGMGMMPGQAGQPGMGMMPGQAGQPGMGMMPGQAGQPGMMGGDMGQMMQMMQRMMAMRQGGMSPGATRMFDRIEGQLAYFRAELRVTDAQMPQWNAFADAVRTQSRTLRQAVMQAMQSAGQPAPAPAQLERRAALLRAQLDATQAIAASASALYGALSDEQKRLADELMAEHLRDMRMRGL